LVETAPWEFGDFCLLFDVRESCFPFLGLANYLIDKFEQLSVFNFAIQKIKAVLGFDVV